MTELNVGAGLDLSAAADFLEDIMAEGLVVARSNGQADDVLDPETGELTEAQPRTAVYVGRGFIQPLSGFTAMADPDVSRIVEETGAKYRAGLPAGDTSDIKVGDEVWVSESHNPNAGPLLLTKVFQVVDLAGVSSFQVARFLYLKQIADTNTPGVVPPWPTGGTVTVRAVILEEGESPPAGTEPGTLFLIRPAS